MMSFAVSKGMSIRKGSIVATCGGIGIVVISIAIPLLHKVVTYKQTMYGSSVLIVISLSLYGLGNGEVYISAKVNSEESEYFLQSHGYMWHMT